MFPIFPRGTGALSSAGGSGTNAAFAAGGIGGPAANFGADGGGFGGLLLRRFTAGLDGAFAAAAFFMAYASLRALARRLDAAVCLGGIGNVPYFYS
jgi:hypothetical protein